MPGRRRTAEELQEDAAISAAKSKKLKIQARLAQLNELLNRREDLLDKIVDHALDLERESVLVVDPQRVPAQPAPGPPRPSQAEAIQTRQALSRKIDRRHYRMDLLDLMDWKTICFELDKLRFTPHALTVVLVERGQRQKSKERLSELVEFLTKIDFRFEIGTNYFETMGDLVKWLLELKSKVPGHALRSSTLPLPPEWQTHGVYSKDEQEETYVKVSTRYLTPNETITIAYGFKDLTWDADEELEITYNFSDNRAKICSASCKEGVLLCPLFSNKAQKLAIKDRSTDGAGDGEAAGSSAPRSAPGSRAASEAAPTARMSGFASGGSRWAPAKQEGADQSAALKNWDCRKRRGSAGQEHRRLPAPAALSSRIRRPRTRTWRTTTTPTTPTRSLTPSPRSRSF